MFPPPYTDIADGLCCLLTGPCLAAPDPVHISQSAPIMRAHSFNWTTVDRYMTQFKH